MKKITVFIFMVMLILSGCQSGNSWISGEPADNRVDNESADEQIPGDESADEQIPGNEFVDERILDDESADDESVDERMPDAVVMNFSHGSAENPEGTTIVISIFVSDCDYIWDMDTETDQETVSNICEYLRIAAAYIESSVQDYGKSAAFITDFERYPDLAYFVRFRQSVTDEGTQDEMIWEHIRDSVDVSGLMTEYQADNCIFFVCVNTDENFTGITCTRDWYEGMPYPYELVYLYNCDSGEINCPAVYAHEILHTFGAWDYYTDSSETGYSRAVMKKMEPLLENDIMYTCSDFESGEYLYDRISNTISEMTAYYIGLTAQSTWVEQYGLVKSQHSG